MAIFSYNRKLAALTIGALLYAALALAISIGPQTPDGQPQLRLSGPPGAFAVEGLLEVVAVQDGQVKLTIKTPDGNPVPVRSIGPAANKPGAGGAEVSKLPPDISITFVGNQPGPAMKRPQLEGDAFPIAMPTGGHAIVAGNYLIKLGHNEVRIIPRDAIREGLQRMLDGRPAEKRRRGDNGEGQDRPRNGERRGPPRDRNGPPPEGEGPPPDGQGPPSDGEQPPPDF